jgi:hypothetical protein
MYVSQLVIAVTVLAVLAGVGLGIAAALIFVLKRRKVLALKKKAFVASREANKEGMHLTDEILESIATGDVVELVKELEALEKIAVSPGGFRVALDPVFTRQLYLRLNEDPVRRPEVLKAVDDWRKMHPDTGTGA